MGLSSMSLNSWIILGSAAVVLALIMLWKNMSKAGKLGKLGKLNLGKGMWGAANVFSLRRKSLVSKLEAETEKARKKAEELQAILDAKKALAEARAKNAELRGTISRVSMDNVEGEPPKPPKRIIR